MTTIALGTVLRILNEEDVEGLLAAGAPADEYEAEAQMIVDALERLSRADMVLGGVEIIVTDVCNWMFGPFDDEQLRQRQAVYRCVAERILQAHQQL